MSEEKKEVPVRRLITFNPLSISLDMNTGDFTENATNAEVMRIVKGAFSNKDRFLSRFIDRFRIVKNDVKPKTGERLTMFECDEILDRLIELYDQVEPYTYKEAFEIENTTFQAKVFGSIDIGEMMDNLGHERVATQGKLVSHKQFDHEGNFTGIEDYDVIYEVHKVDGTDIGLPDEDLYALKCWCTSTNKEHWLWIEAEYKDSPLDAVASLCRVHQNLIPNIKEIKRQGDILLVEMIDDTIEPEGDIVPLTADQYFGLLTAQS